MKLLTAPPLPDWILVKDHRSMEQTQHSNIVKKTENMLETKTNLQQSDLERKSHCEVHDNSKSLTTLVPDDCGDSKYVIHTYNNI